MGERLVKRREVLETHVLPKALRANPVFPQLRASLEDLIQAVKAHCLESVVAKRTGSKYEPSLRCGTCQKMRGQSGTGVRDCWIHALGKELRFTDDWLLR